MDVPFCTYFVNSNNKKRTKQNCFASWEMELVREAKQREIIQKKVSKTKAFKRKQTRTKVEEKIPYLSAKRATAVKGTWLWSQYCFVSRKRSSSNASGTD